MKSKAYVEYTPNICLTEIKFSAKKKNISIFTEINHQIEFLKAIYCLKNNISSKLNYSIVTLKFGDRFYFSCPNCGRNCIKLYLNGDNLNCRKCSNLSYLSSCSHKNILYENLVRNKRIVEKITSKLKLHPKTRAKNRHVLLKILEDKMKLIVNNDRLLKEWLEKKQKNVEMSI